MLLGNRDSQLTAIVESNPVQLELDLYQNEILVDGMQDSNSPEIVFVGYAKRNNDGRWVALAKICGKLLCRVEVNIRMGQEC